MNTAVVIVTYNNAATVGACLRSTAGIGNSIVVDNASTDTTAAIVRGHPVTLIQQTKNIGFGAAANRGAAAANTPYILFLNPDATLEDSIQPAIDYLEKHPKIGIIGLNVIDHHNKTELDSFGNKPTLLHVLARHVWVARKSAGPRSTKAWRLRPQGRGSSGVTGPRRSERVNGVRDPYWVSGAAMIVRRDVFQQLKGFDESFFLYWEDIDLCHRARVAGYGVAWLSAVRVRHQRGASLSDRKRKAALYDRSADRYFQKHYAAPIWLLHRFLRFFYRFFFPLAR